jgi:excisionase family DNA binding protein
MALGGDMHDSDNTIDPLLTPEQVAKLLVVSEETLSAWRSTGRQQLPFVRIGKLPRYRPQDVAAYIESNLQAA